MQNLSLTPLELNDNFSAKFYASPISWACWDSRKFQECVTVLETNVWKSNLSEGCEYEILITKSEIRFLIIEFTNTPIKYSEVMLLSNLMLSCCYHPTQHCRCALCSLLLEISLEYIHTHIEYIHTITDSQYCKNIIRLIVRLFATLAL